MERTVKAHIADLERILHELNEQLMREEDVRARNELESKIRAAELALQHYRTALELENHLAHQ